MIKIEVETKRADKTLTNMEDLSMDEIIAENNETKVGVFKIVDAKKRTIKNSAAGQAIEVLKRAKTPMTAKAVASRIRGTKAGKDVEVTDLKARTKKVLDWYVKNTDFIEKTDQGYALTVV